MALPLTVPPKAGHKSFLFSPVHTDLDTLDAHIAFLGIDSELAAGAFFFFSGV